ncbi:hypothetical protein QTP88_015867 [Uroleucon formosanum]
MLEIQPQPQLRPGVGFLEKQSRVRGNLEMSGRKSHEPFQKMLHVVNARRNAIDAHTPSYEKKKQQQQQQQQQQFIGMLR